MDSNALVSFATDLTSSSLTVSLLECIMHHTPLFVLDSVYYALHANKAHTLRDTVKRPSFSIAAKLK